jgi:putative NIF3 family GTP cyclohydrolase 1 type 2
MAQCAVMLLSRRSFLFSSTVAIAGPAAPRTIRPFVRQASDRVLTAAGILERIKANVGIPWMAQTVDNIVAGSPDTRVRGIATTMMATLDVLKRASAAGRNMVITHESTFFTHQDRIDDIRTDPTYQFKADFIEKSAMAVFHFHDHWHRRTPDGIATGMARELGWEKYATTTSPREFVFPEQALADLARSIESRLKIRTMRVVGDPKQRVTRVLASWGNVSLMPGIPYLARPDIDALIVGETREWELVEYVQDQIASGNKKALIVVGHVVSEQAGMKYCAEWLKSFIDEVPIEFIAADEPFWRPEQPIG